MLIRLNKALADLGIASRRKADDLIEDGVIKVNGEIVTELGTKVDLDKDVISVNDQTKIKISQDRKVIMLNKPAGVVTSSLRVGKDKIVMDFVKSSMRLFPVGRLDKLSRGLLLLTNEGLFAYHMTHPRFEKEKEYLVRVAGLVTPDIVTRLSEGMNILGSKTKPAQVTKLGNSVLKIVITEGKNRQIRRMLRKLSLHVSDLQRVRIGTLRLGDLAEGQTRELTAEEITTLDPQLK